MHTGGGAHDNVEHKLTAARTQLVIEKPFLGALVLRLPLSAADPSWCPTTATDAQRIYYNPDHIRGLTLAQTKFVLAHEALHCALSHFHRRQHRARRRWDVACDFAINGLLAADGLAVPPGGLLRADFNGMAAEEIYPCIREDTEETTLDRHLYDEGDDSAGRRASGGGANISGPATAPSPAPEHHDASNERGPGATETSEARPAPLAPGERERLAMQWQLRLAGAAQQALRAGKLSAAMARIVDDLLQPQLPWRMLLARYLSASARTDYSFSRPSRREGAAILPGLRAGHVDVVVVIDTSGSIELQEMREFLSEVNAIKGAVNARIRLHACDAALAPDGPWLYEAWDELRLPRKLTGGGGTRFTPAFEWAGNLDHPPDLLIYFTDAQGEFPKQEPAFPVLWLVKGRASVPWGQRIQLN